MKNNDYKKLAKEILEKMESEHIYLYHSITKEEILLFIDDCFEKYKIQNDFDFNYIMNVILKKINGTLDAHTDFKYNKSQRLPFSFLMIDGDVYLVNVTNKYKKFLFSKLISINDTPINTILKEIRNSTSFQTESWFKHKAQEKLSDYYEILSLPSISSDVSKLFFKFGNDTMISLSLNQINVLKDKLKKEDNSSELVFTLKKNFNYFIEENKIVFIYNSCKDKNKELLKSIENVKKDIENSSIDTFILDLRGNTGGDSSIIKPLIDYLRNSNLNLITLVDRGVFSSGIIALNDMIDIGSEVIGEEVGAYINGFGECTKYFQIDSFEYRICQKYFYQENGEWRQINDKKQLMLSSKKIFIPEVIKSDIIVTPKMEDLKKGKDTILEYALNFHNKNWLKR